MKLVEGMCCLIFAVMTVALIQSRLLPDLVSIFLVCNLFQEGILLMIVRSYDFFIPVASYQ